MPNWCSNTLELSGDKEVIKKITDWHKDRQSGKTDDVGLFSLFYPTPKELATTTYPNPEPNEDLIKKFGSSNWYDFQTTNWGTKWDANEVCMAVESENGIRLSFDTAWAPPIAFYEKLSRDYPELNISASYYESGCDFCGTFESDFGEETLSITDIQEKCLATYKEKYKDYVDEPEFRQRLEGIYRTKFYISNYVDVYEIFPDYFFDEKLEDAEFCKEFKIKPEKENQ
jgi:hypothetical protein